MCGKNADHCHCHRTHNLTGNVRSLSSYTQPLDSLGAVEGSYAAIWIHYTAREPCSLDRASLYLPSFIMHFKLAILIAIMNHDLKSSNPFKKQERLNVIFFCPVNMNASFTIKILLAWKFAFTWIIRND